eukprot:TRINITY_DN11338_c0_g1_i1.p1 TRINITY_DN11338_c0_g1~~TRINITY_DN11338_c0_g1_i1.p1  ORF type:complete len:307 (+),score=63.77 TRINITY_DN11338_c0_g1_i1:128-1048(+)
MDSGGASVVDQGDIIWDGTIDWNWKGPSQWKNVRYDVFHFVMVFIYFVLLIIAIVMFKKYHYNSRTFKVMLILGTVVRMFFFLMQPFIIEGILRISNAFNVFFNSLPSFFYFSAYIMILFFWMQIYKTNMPHKLKTVDRAIWVPYVTFNLVMYGIAIILYTLDFLVGGGVTARDYSSVPQAQNKYEVGVFCMTASLYIVVSVGFFFYGYCAVRHVYYENVEVALQRIEERRALLRRVAVITLICMACFVCRAIITLLALFDKSMNFDWYLDGIYYCGLEVVPLLMMLRAYSPTKKKSGVRSPLIPS